MNSVTAYSTGRSPLNELRREMDRLFDDFWSPSWSRGRQTAESQWTPLCDVEEADHHYLISVEMPGVPKDQIQLDLHENQLILSGERRQESKKNHEDGGWYSERRYGKFQRSFTLPPGVDVDKVEASYQDGVLTVYLPKAESAKPRQIKIGNGSGTGFFGKFLGSAKKESPEGLRTASSTEVKTERAAG